MAWTPHVTVAAVIQRDNTYLLVEELIDGESVINQPAGHLDDNESLVDAVVREVQEETAWLFRPQGIVGIYRYKHMRKNLTYVRVAFCGTVSDHNPEQTLDTPIIKASWYTREQVLNSNARSPMVLRCIDDSINQPHHPLDMLHDL